MRLGHKLIMKWISCLFALLVLGENESAQAAVIMATVVMTVFLSVLLHGVTAAPGARWYSRVVGRMGECEETQPVTEIPTRFRDTNSN